MLRTMKGELAGAACPLGRGHFQQLNHLRPGGGGLEELEIAPLFSPPHYMGAEMQFRGGSGC